MLSFHLDEHVPHAIAHGLRRRHIDVTTATDAGLLNASDEDHLAFAAREGRVVFTNDRDFLRLGRRASRTQESSIVRRAIAELAM